LGWVMLGWFRLGSVGLGYVSLGSVGLGYVRHVCKRSQMTESPVKILQSTLTMTPSFSVSFEANNSYEICIMSFVCVCVCVCVRVRACLHPLSTTKPSVTFVRECYKTRILRHALNGMRNDLLFLPRAHYSHLLLILQSFDFF